MGLTLLTLAYLLSWIYKQDSNMAKGGLRAYALKGFRGRNPKRREEKSYIPYCIQTAPHPQKL